MLECAKFLWMNVKFSGNTQLKNVLTIRLAVISWDI